MQGRLSPQVDGKIQAFPHDCWQQEFALAEANGWQIMEWTIDQEKIEENPLMTVQGRALIHQLMKKHGIAIPSVTADFTMQAPFYKFAGSAKNNLLDQLRHFLICAADIGIKRIVIPLVDNGSLTTQSEEAALREGLATLEDLLRTHHQVIVFESDFAPARLYDFIATFSEPLFGINYDLGNSASLGYDVVEEFKAYGPHIKNIHIKDRPYQGTTVPLGKGNVDFTRFF